MQVVREGNPGHRAVTAQGVVFPPTALVEPDWVSLLSGDAEETVQLRRSTARLWRKLASTLSRSVGLVGEQQEVLVDYCITWARIEQGERALSRQGMLIDSPRADRGRVRNPWTTVLNQYRSHFRKLAAELGLTPSAASQILLPQTSDEEDPFD